MNFVKMFLFFLVFALFSCKNEKEESVKKSDDIFFKAESEIIMTGYQVNIDSFRRIYNDLKKQDFVKAFDFANDFKKMAVDLKKQNQVYIDSLAKIRELNTIQNNELAEKKWSNSKAAKIQKQFPNWSREECEKIANNEIWIGMKLEMIKYLRGNPNSADVSNYGYGEQWQWCWDDYKPSCFYGGNDGIITAYN